MNLSDYIIYDEPDDHRLLLVGGRLYIFDRSGDTPLDTDDGPLEILDRSVWVDDDGLSVEAYRPGSDEPRTVRISTSLARQMTDNEGFTLHIAPRTP